MWCGRFSGVSLATPSLLRASYPFFLALIVNIDFPYKLGDFRLISLLGCLYKIVAKVLASRLCQVMDSIGAYNQSAFIPKRQIACGIAIIN